MLFVLFFFSLFVEPSSADQGRVFFSHTKKRNPPCTHHFVCLHPDSHLPQNSPFFFFLPSSLFVFHCHFHEMWVNAPMNCQKGDPGKILRYSKCYNRWNSCRTMGVSVQTSSLQEHRCMAVLSAFILACMVRPALPMTLK